MRSISASHSSFIGYCVGNAVLRVLHAWLRRLKNAIILSAWYIGIYLFMSPKIGWHGAKIDSNAHLRISVEKLLEMAKNFVKIQIVQSKKHADCHQCYAVEGLSWNSIPFQLLFGVTRWRSQEKTPKLQTSVEIQFHAEIADILRKWFPLFPLFLRDK